MHVQPFLRTSRFALVVAILTQFIPTASARGEEVILLETDRAALQTRLQLIETATQSLDICYFIVEDDCIAHLFFSALLDAAQRGVCVRMVIDAMYNDMNDCTLRQLLSAGAQIKEYHPLSVVKPLTLTRRMHDKIVIRDGVEMVVGSRNINDAHFGISVLQPNYTDLDLYVTGPVVAQANAYYQCLWESKHIGDAKPEHEPLLTLPFRNASSKHDKGGDSGKGTGRTYRVSDEPNPMETCWQRYDALMAGKLNCRPEHDLLSVSCVQLAFDPRGKKSLHMGTRQTLYEILDHAQCSIVLQSPYIIPAEKLGRILRRAARRGVTIHILTNSLETTDQVLAYSAFAREAPECARAGIQFWEYGAPKCLHAKSFVVDGHIACVTSFNFDARSAFLNTELATIVYDEAFATLLLEAMARNFEEAYPMELQGHRLVSNAELTTPGPLRTRQTRVYGGISTLNRIPGVSRVSEPGFRLLQGLTYLFQRQL